MQPKIDERYNQVIDLVQGKMNSFMAICKTPAQQLFLLNYFYSVFDTITAAWFDFGFEEKPRPFFEYPGNEDLGRFYPRSVRWHNIDNPDFQKATVPHRIELYPQYEIENNDGSKKQLVDFALFFPRTDDPSNKIKVAVACDAKPTDEMTDRELLQQKEQDRFFRSGGWIIARFTGEEIGQKDMYDLMDKVHNLAMDKDYELFHLAAELKNNWRFN